MPEGSPPGDRSLREPVRTLAGHDVFLVAALLWFLGKFVRYAFPPLFETFQTTYRVTPAATGLAFSGFMLVYALLQFPSGALADRFGSMRVIAGGGLVAGLGSLWLLLEPPFVLLAVAMAVIGGGTGAHKTVAVRLLSTAYPAHLGRTLGVFDTVGAGGGVLAPLVVAAILGTALLEWPALFGLAALAFLGATGLVLLVGRTTSVEAEVEQTDRVLPVATYRRTFRRPKVLGFVGVTVLMSFGYNGLVAFLPLYLVAEGGVTPAMASLLYGVLFVASVTQVVTGEATDRVGPLRIITICLGATTLGVGVLVGFADGLAIAGPVAFAPVVLAIGLGAHGYRPGRDVYIVSLVPEAATGGAMGLFRTILMAAGAVSPGVVGVTVDRLGYPIAFGGLATVLVLATGLAMAIAIQERRADARVPT